jgi:molybdopterin-binding protein
MNTITAEVQEIQSIENLNIITFFSQKQHLKMMSLELSKKLHIGSKVSLSVKATNIALAKGTIGLLSYSNQLEVIILDIDEGVLLSSIKVDFFGETLESIITTDSKKRMHLHVGESVTALIKSSDLALERIL